MVFILEGPPLSLSLSLLLSLSSPRSPLTPPVLSPPPLGGLPSAKQGQCNSHCQLLDLLLVCPKSVSDVIKSIDYLDLQDCGNHTLHSGAPQCLPKPTYLLPSASGQEGI